MSEQQEVHLPNHGGAGWTPKKVLFAFLAGLLVPIVTIVLVAHLFIDTSPTEVPKPATVEANIKPFGEVSVVNPNAPVVELTGEQVVTNTCSACHATGALGAPKIGNKSEWGPRIAEGYATLIKHAMNGYKAMPAKGGNTSLDQYEISEAIAYMANKAGANFKAPAPPAQAASATPASSATPPAGSSNKASPSSAPLPTSPAPAQKMSPSASSAKPAMKNSDMAEGKQVFEGTCIACHGSGVMGAPKAFNKADWAPHLAKGKATLLQHAMNGYKAMPPHGGNPSLTEAQLSAAIDYMSTPK
ncbi:MAG TPA: c-type cytochrome [Burkholderiales bacterium]|nr:c-type cytochrome [Burkholderiales bacterium]